MINYKLQGHSLGYEVQTMIQVFYPNRHYYQVEEITKDTLLVESIWTEKYSQAVLYENGNRIGEYTLPYCSKELSEKDKKRIIKTAVYRLLKQVTKIEPKWGLLTGIRPAKTVNQLFGLGYSQKECMQYLMQNYDVSESKALLTVEVAQAEKKILSKNNPETISIYIGIPFCPTTCLYCSFTSYPLAQYKNKVDAYLSALILEMKYLSEYAKQYHVQSVYIGGGTPTVLTEKQLERLLQETKKLFSTDTIKEFTVEAGRPDTITEKKLKLMKAYGVNRISINPQTMNQKTLETVGRCHSVEEIKNIVATARKIGHDCINMDVILGLPGETVTDIENTMQKICSLNPDNITVHTLAVKRASRLKEKFDTYLLTSVEEMEEMLEVSQKYVRSISMKPYYIYRQKNMIGNFENVGYCKEGKEGIYNVQIMEEKQTVLAAGAGASTKIYYEDINQVKRIFNVKNVDEYIARIEEMIQRKKDRLPFKGRQEV